MTGLTMSCPVAKARRMAAWLAALKSAILGSGEPNGRSVFSRCRSLSESTNHVPSGSGVATNWS